MDPGWSLKIQQIPLEDIVVFLCDARDASAVQKGNFGPRLPVPVVKSSPREGTSELRHPKFQVCVSFLFYFQINKSSDFVLLHRNKVLSSSLRVSLSRISVRSISQNKIHVFLYDGVYTKCQAKLQNMSKIHPDAFFFISYYLCKL